MEEWFEGFAHSFMEAVWGLPLVVTLTGAGLIFTFLTRGIQLRAITHGFQVIRGKYDNPNDEGNISHFQALCTALSATVGLGNIAGVATAVSIGGAGAVFWMWVVGFLGMATKFMTCSLATMYREKDPSGTFRGGPMYYIELGLGSNWKFLAMIFAFLGAAASLGAGNMFQSNQVASIVTHLFESQNLVSGEEEKLFSHRIIGGVLCILSLLVIVGGIQRIGSVAAKIVPTMCVLYVVGALVVIVMNFGQVPTLLLSIFTQAFTGSAAGGAFLGIAIMQALKQGVQRACFSNEAGLGSAPIAHSTAKTNEPIREGVVAAIGPFIDTIVICTMTALVILITNAHAREAVATVSSISEQVVHYTDDKDKPKAYVQVKIDKIGEWSLTQDLLVAQPEKIRNEKRLAGSKDEPKFDSKAVISFSEADGFAKLSYPVKKSDSDTHTLAFKDAIAEFEDKIKPLFIPGNPVYQNLEGIRLTAAAFDQVIYGFGTWFLPFAAFFFAFSTIISWGFYGETCTRYLLGDRAVLPFKLIYCSMIFVGANFTTLKPVLNLSDALLGLMLIPNLIGTGLLAPKVLAASRDYFSRLKSGAFEEEARLAAEAKAKGKP